MSHHHGDTNKNVLLFAFIFTSLFALLEIVYGFITNSLSLLSEGVHMASDGLSLGLAAFAVSLGLRSASQSKMFGYKRAEPIAAFLNGLGLMVIPILVFIEALKRLLFGTQDILSTEMLIVAIIGLIVNLIVAFVLTRGEKDNINVRAATLHVIADLLSSTSTIVVSLLIMYFHFQIIDIVASIVISIIIFSGGLKITKESLNILMEGKPDDLNLDVLNNNIFNINEVIDIKDIKIWSVSADEKYINLKITINDLSNYEKVLSEIKKITKQNDLNENIEIII